MSEEGTERSRWGILRFWPWLGLVLAFLMAVWHDIDFPEDVDPEFPAVVRPTFNRRPPPAYRLAEPGDTLDRIAIYTSALGVVISLVGFSVREEDSGRLQSPSRRPPGGTRSRRVRPSTAGMGLDGVQSLIRPAHRDSAHSWPPWHVC